MPGDPGRSRHRGAHKMSAASGSLASLEITVTRTSASLPGLEPIVIHRETHRATRLTPLKARIPENLIQPFGLGLCLNQSRTWNHQDLPHRIRFATTARNPCSRSQILYSGIRTRPDKHPIDPDVSDWGVGDETHVL
jgi:hypothetical protein